MTVVDVGREVEKRLLSLDLETGRVVAFRIRWDNDFAASVADVLCALPGDKNETWDLALLDRLSDRVGECLEDLVAFSYCEFRTPDGALQELASRDDPPWIPLERGQSDQAVLPGLT